ncbi:MAG: [FeFe] hydrogenase H-cluster radical SAM maturase HydE [Ichthyobacteriaceae bacterium]|nr:[FeFe] hydrogenase H-cluster radical SAM maturase HydE [Ichthyobacteriaceae bacterium]
MHIQQILNNIVKTQGNASEQEINELLNANEADTKLLFAKSEEVKKQNVGNFVYLRGLIELSNYCVKDCLYCGIRKSNTHVDRYIIDIKDVFKRIDLAIENNYSSIVIQAGERTDDVFINTVTEILEYAKQKSNGELGITISLGEQTKDVYQKWFNAGAHRYLLRIESSDRDLFGSIHPKNQNHSYNTRLQKLNELKEVGYQIGSGVMIGLPKQTTKILAQDLLFLKNIDIDMCGMGPYIISQDTPMGIYENEIPTDEKRIELSLKMIAILRLIMPKINIASTTALQTLAERAREEGVRVGANILMPNITEFNNKKNYNLYKKKTTITEIDDDLSSINEQMNRVGNEVKLGMWGDSLHFAER